MELIDGAARGARVNSFRALSSLGAYIGLTDQGDMVWAGEEMMEEFLMGDILLSDITLEKLQLIGMCRNPFSG